jgi:hypothetical protein
MTFAIQGAVKPMYWILVATILPARVADRCPAAPPSTQMVAAASTTASSAPDSTDRRCQTKTVRHASNTPPTMSGAANEISFRTTHSFSQRWTEGWVRALSAVLGQLERFGHSPAGLQIEPLSQTHSSFHLSSD